MSSPIGGGVELVGGEYWEISPFTLQQSLRLGKDARVQAFIASMAEHAPRMLTLRSWIASQSEPLKAEAVEALCAAIEGHEACLVALAALATGRSVQAIEALSETDQAVIILAMIAENQSFFGRRLASHLQETGLSRTSSSNSLAMASGANT